MGYVRGGQSSRKEYLLKTPLKFSYKRFFTQVEVEKVVEKFLTISVAKVESNFNF